MCAAKIIHYDLLIFALVETVSEGGRSGLVYDAADFKSGNFTCVFRGLSLAVVKIRGDGYNRLVYLGANLVSASCLSF